MTTEYESRVPHVRTYTIVENGNTKIARIDVNDRGIVQLTEEILDQIMRRAGYTETTKANDEH